MGGGVDGRRELLHCDETYTPTLETQEEEEGVFRTSGDWRGKDNSRSRYAGATSLKCLDGENPRRSELLHCAEFQ